MNKLIKLDDLEYPVSIAEFKRRHKNVSFPAQIPFGDYGYAVVFPVARPTAGRLHRAMEGPPALASTGVYEQTYTVVDAVAGMSGTELGALLSSIKDSKLKAVRDLSSEKSTGNLFLDGLEFRTDNKVLAEITAATSMIGRNPTETIDFKGVAGWSVATKAVLEGMQDAIWVQRKSVRAAQRSHEDAINALTSPEDADNYDTSIGWPS